MSKLLAKDDTVLVDPIASASGQKNGRSRTKSVTTCSGYIRASHLNRNARYDAGPRMTSSARPGPDGQTAVPASRFRWMFPILLAWYSGGHAWPVRTFWTRRRIGAAGFGVARGGPTPTRRSGCRETHHGETVEGGRRRLSAR